MPVRTPAARSIALRPGAAHRALAIGARPVHGSEPAVWIAERASNRFGVLDPVF